MDGGNRREVKLSRRRRDRERKRATGSGPAGGVLPQVADTRVVHLRVRIRDDFTPESDVDFLVSFEPGTPLTIDRLLEMKEELETRLGRPVDLVEKEALRNPWRKHEILKTREVIYAD